MRAVFLSIVVLSLGGCSLFLATDDLSGNENANGADGGGSSSGDGAASSSGGSSGAASSSGDAGGDGGGSNVKRGPLVYVQSSGETKTRVDGFFELTFKDSKWRHPVEWADLSVSNANLAGSMPLYQSPRAQIDGVWQDDDAVPSGADWGVVDVGDFTPVAVTFNTYVHHVMSGGRDLKRWARFTVHATGRVVVESSIANPAAATISIDQWTYHDVDVAAAVGWDIQDLPDKSAAGFFAQNAPTSFAIVNQAGETTLAGPAGHRAWKVGATTLTTGTDQKRLGEIQLGITKTDFQARVEDVRNPAVEVFEGGIGAESTYVQASGFYAVKASTGTLKVGLGPTRARHYPSFVVTDLTSASNWKVSLDGKTIASATTAVTADGVGRYFPNEGVLYFSYFGVIPQNASQNARTFVVER